METKPLLAFDCATAGASVALRHQNETYLRTLPQGEQASGLVEAIDALMREHGLRYADLECMVTTIGPGSFTGVRIGLAALHGFSLASGVAIKTLTSLQALAWDVALEHTSPLRGGVFYFMTALRAGKGEIYAQAFEMHHTTPVPTGDIFLAPETQTDFGMPCYSNLQPDTEFFIASPNAATLCAIAHHLPEMLVCDALPAYIRAPDAKIPAKLHWL